MMRIRPKVNVPGAIRPACFSTPLSSIRCFSRLPGSIFHADPHAGQSHNAHAETGLAHARAFGLEPGGPVLRTAAPRAQSHSVFIASPATTIARGPEAATLRLIGSLSGFRCFRALAIHCTPLSEIV